MSTDNTTYALPTQWRKLSTDALVALIDEYANRDDLDACDMIGEELAWRNANA